MPDAQEGIAVDVTKQREDARGVEEQDLVDLGVVDEVLLLHEHREPLRERLRRERRVRHSRATAPAERRS